MLGSVISCLWHLNDIMHTFSTKKTDVGSSRIGVRMRLEVFGVDPYMFSVHHADTKAALCVLRVDDAPLLVVQIATVIEVDDAHVVSAPEIDRHIVSSSGHCEVVCWITIFGSNQSHRIKSHRIIVINHGSSARRLTHRHEGYLSRHRWRCLH